MSANGYDAYGSTHKESLKGRALEGEAFMKAARLLRQAQDFPENKRQWRDALEYCRKLWMIVDADMKSSHHHLDITIRENLLALCGYVEDQCIAAKKKPHPQMLQGLIDVNSEIARGLLGTG